MVNNTPKTKPIVEMQPILKPCFEIKRGHWKTCRAKNAPYLGRTSPYPPSTEYPPPPGLAYIIYAGADPGIFNGWAQTLLKEEKWWRTVSAKRRVRSLGVPPLNPRLSNPIRSAGVIYEWVYWASSKICVQAHSSYNAPGVLGCG